MIAFEDRAAAACEFADEWLSKQSQLSGLEKVLVLVR
jgi:hypothetical protein